MSSSPDGDKSGSVPDFSACLQFLRKHKLADTENLLKKELLSRSEARSQQVRRTQQQQMGGQSQMSPLSSSPVTAPMLPSVASVSAPLHHLKAKDQSTNMLSSYNSEGDPKLYQEVYQDLLRFVDSSLDLYRHELALILYPVFVHMYLELVYNCHEAEAKAFGDKFGPIQESFYQNDIQKLSYITKKQHMIGSELMENFQTSQFTVRMSRDTYTQLRQLKKAISDEKKYSVLWNIIQEHLYLDVYEGMPRNKRQIDATSGGLIGEANRQANRSKVYFGLLREPDISGFLQFDDEYETDPNDKTKKRKLKKEQALLKKQKTDPHAPSLTRLPLPDLRDSDKADKAKAFKEAQRRQNLDEQSLPSACFYTVINSGTTVTSVTNSDDSTLLALGFANAHIRVCTLAPTKLRGLKSADDLQEIDPDADDVLHRMIDDSTGESAKSLHGHSGAVFGLSFSPDKLTLLSCSEDGTIRLWSLQTWTCLVIFRGHVLPVWQVEFSPLGMYFVSGGNDKTARLWSTESSACVRVFAGHFSDVDCVIFHPNTNYVASGSGDRSIRLWDCVTGNCVRLMTGHKESVSALAFSYDGRFLASGGSDHRVLLWDIAHGHLLGDFSTHHKSMITSLCFSRDNTVLASSSSSDSTIALWNFAKFSEELNLEEVNITHNPNVNADADKYKMTAFYAKDTPILGIHFTRRNLILAVGSYL